MYSVQGAMTQGGFSYPPTGPGSQHAGLVHVNARRQLPYRQISAMVKLFMVFTIGQSISLARVFSDMNILPLIKESKT
jgi:hypothetical protein